MIWFYETFVITFITFLIFTCLQCCFREVTRTYLNLLENQENVKYKNWKNKSKTNLKFEIKLILVLGEKKT
jgi:hypothetical protein